jgi:hypothetical protein
LMLHSPTPTTAGTHTSPPTATATPTVSPESNYRLYLPVIVR